MNLLRTYEKLSTWPLGKKIFSSLVCLKAPYFASISPLITHLTKNDIVVEVRKRHKVLNHIKTVHAIAMANACELAAGVLMQVGLPGHMRWIPKSMNITYLKKAETSVIAKTHVGDWMQIGVGDNIIKVEVFDKGMNKVVEADITMWISLK